MNNNKQSKCSFLYLFLQFNSHNRGMPVALPYDFDIGLNRGFVTPGKSKKSTLWKTLFVRNILSCLAARFFVIIPGFILTPIMKSRFMKENLLIPKTYNMHIKYYMEVSYGLSLYLRSFCFSNIIWLFLY